MPNDIHIPFRRLNGFSLDMSSVFSSLTEAECYVSGYCRQKGVPYLGQIISVIDTESGTSAVTVYKIDLSGDTFFLNEIGSGKGSVADVQSKDNDIKVTIEGETVWLRFNSITNSEFTYNNGKFIKEASD